MQPMPLFLGACALVSIAGVVSGTAINATPIQRGGIGMNDFARPSVDFASDRALSAQTPLPDHYAINTPEGRYDVAELSARGIYAQRRYAWRDAAYVVPPEPRFEEPQAEPFDDYGAVAEPELVSAPATPEELSAPAAPAEPGGQAELIDVGAALADS